MFHTRKNMWNKTIKCFTQEKTYVKQNSKMFHTKLMKSFYRNKCLWYIIYNFFKTKYRGGFVIEKYDLVNLIQNYEYYLDRLSSLVYGSLDIRGRDNKKYIYVHFRKDGKIITKYVGEYTENLYNEILSNNVEIKEINKKIRYIEKYIKEKDYKKKEVSEETKDNIRKVSNNKEKLLLDLAKLENINISVENIYNILSNTEVNNILSDEVVKFYNLLNGFEYCYVV